MASSARGTRPWAFAGAWKRRVTSVMPPGAAISACRRTKRQTLKPQRVGGGAPSVPAMFYQQTRRTLHFPDSRGDPLGKFGATFQRSEVTPPPPIPNPPTQAPRKATHPPPLNPKLPLRKRQGDSPIFAHPMAGVSSRRSKGAARRGASTKGCAPSSRATGSRISSWKLPLPPESCTRKRASNLRVW